MNAPVVNSTISQDITVLKSQMSYFLNALAGYGIVPMGSALTTIGHMTNITQEMVYLSLIQASFSHNNRLMYRAQTTIQVCFTSSMYTMKAEELEQIYKLY